jgi:acetyltransferase-like isoleucine patch superfamily enzyme
MFMHSQAELGERVYIGSNCIVGLATVGDDTMLADHVYILSGRRQHGISDPAIRFQDQPRTFTRIHIGRNCWLGTNTVVMADIGNDCVIGAGSVVTRAIPSGSVAVGNPARVIRPTFADFDKTEATLQQSTLNDD